MWTSIAPAMREAPAVCSSPVLLYALAPGCQRAQASLPRTFSFEVRHPQHVSLIKHIVRLDWTLVVSPLLHPRRLTHWRSSIHATQHHSLLLITFPHLADIESMCTFALLGDIVGWQHAENVSGNLSMFIWAPCKKNSFSICRSASTNITQTRNIASSRCPALNQAASFMRPYRRC